MTGIIGLAGCGSRQTEEDPQRVVKAEAAIADLEREFARIHDLAPRERLERYLSMRKDLEKAVELTSDLPLGFRDVTGDDKASLSGTAPMRISYNYHSKALYWLAWWRLLYARGQGVDELLDRMERQLSQVLAYSGRALRVQLRLRQGRTAEARALTAQLAQQMPEYGGLFDLVGWYERVGQVAPFLAGRNLGGGTADPWAPSERWILAVFTQGSSPDTSFYLERLRLTLATIPEARRPHVVQVTFDGQLLAAAQLGAPGEDLLWVNPNVAEDVARWRGQWKLPQSLPCNAMLGPDRTILAVDLTPEQIAELCVPGSEKK